VSDALGFVGFLFFSSISFFEAQSGSFSVQPGCSSGGLATTRHAIRELPPKK
jgi:hypothetical protein